MKPKAAHIPIQHLYTAIIVPGALHDCTIILSLHHSIITVTCDDLFACRKVHPLVACMLADKCFSYSFTSSFLAAEPQRPPTWLRDYEEAVEKHGAVEVTINQCIFAGPPGKGKSCLKHLLVHNKPKEVKTSTGVMEKPDVVTISAEKYAVEGTSVWLALTDDKMASSIRLAVQDRAFLIPEDEPEDRHSNFAQLVIEINPPIAASKATSRNSHADPSDTKSDLLHLQPSANPKKLSAFHRAHFRLTQDPSLGEGILSSISSHLISSHHQHLHFTSLGLLCTSRCFRHDLPLPGGPAKIH